MRSLLILFLLIPSVSWAQILTQHTTLTESGTDDTVVVVNDVAIEGDTVVVTTKNKIKSLKMRVFRRIDGKWIQTQRPSLKNGWAYSVGIDGDTFVVGTMKSAYVFTDNGRNWTEQAELTPDIDSDSQFGNDVAIDGNTVVVGDPKSLMRDSDAYGSVYVFTRTENTWTKQATLTSDTPNDAFGNSVAISGDTIVAGTKNRGAAYVFSRSDGVWTQHAKLSIPEEDDFGLSVAIDGDTIAVGDIEVDPVDSACPSQRCISCAEAASRCGSVYVFTKSETSWSQQARLAPADDDFDDLFGWSVAIDGDIVVVGSRGFPSHDMSSGSAFVFSRTGETWAKAAKLSPRFVLTDMNWNITTKVNISGGNVVTGNRFGAYFFTNDGLW
jgi:hypothetical protein